MALSTEQKQRIITERLSGVPVRSIVERTGHSTATITKVWKEWQAEHADDRAEQIAAMRDNLLFQLEEMAIDARIEGQAAKKRNDWRAHLAYLRAEESLRDKIARLSGADRPLQVELSGSVSVNVEDQREALRQRVLAYCQSPN